jgi:outer membrane cobalamin receptor
MNTPKKLSFSFLRGTKNRRQVALFFSPSFSHFLRPLFFYGVTLFAASSLKAQENKILGNVDSVYLYQLSIEDLQEDEDSTENYISLATQTLLERKDAPSVVSVMGRREIENSGARDLIDLLRLVPGFDFGVDVNGVIGLGMRGNWSHEGKILLMIDGLEITELLYATNQFGNHISPDQIERIEIIRGPGSAIYGGAAAYAVINVVTKAQSGFEGLEVTQVLGTMEKPNTLRKNLNLSLAKSGQDGAVAVSSFMGDALRSAQPYTDFRNRTIQMREVSRLQTFNLIGNFRYKGLEVRALWDNYRNHTQTGLGYIRPYPYERNFQTGIIDLRYLWQSLGGRLKIVPRFTYTYSNPWNYQNADSLAKAFENVENVRRLRANLSLFYTPREHLNFTFGSEYFNDLAFYRNTFFTGSQWIRFENVALFGQMLWNHRWAHLALGARYENHSFYESVFVPRLGLTKTWTQFHLKLLYSSAFRAPVVQNINFSLNQSIRPEITNVVELEAGYQIDKKLSLTLNFYDINTLDPITYLAVDENTEGYTNYPQTGTRGFEIETRYRFGRGSLHAAYAFYTVAGKPIIDTYRINTEIDNQHLGLAPHKFSLQANYRLYKGLQLNLSSNFLSKRWAFTAETPEGDFIATEQQAALIFNAFLLYRNFLRYGLNLSFGVHDAFNAAPDFIQPYNGGHAPYPTTNREWLLRLNYAVDW